MLSSLANKAAVENALPLHFSALLQATLGPARERNKHLSDKFAVVSKINVTFWSHCAYISLKVPRRAFANILGCYKHHKATEKEERDYVMKEATVKSLFRR